MRARPVGLRPLIVASLLASLAAGPAEACWGHRGYPNFRACFANQKTLAGAIEMYGLDFGTVVTRLSPEVWQELKQRGYLQRVPDDPGAGPGSHSNYVLASSSGNGLLCLRHGALQAARDPTGRPVADPARPRDMLRAAGVTDPDLLERALEERAGLTPAWSDRRDIPRYAARAALRLVTLALTAFGSQPLAWLHAGVR